MKIRYRLSIRKEWRQRLWLHNLSNKNRRWSVCLKKHKRKLRKQLRSSKNSAQKAKLSILQEMWAESRLHDRVHQARKWHQSRNEKATFLLLTLNISKWKIMSCLRRIKNRCNLWSSSWHWEEQSQGLVLRLTHVSRQERIALIVNSTLYHKGE